MGGLLATLLAGCYRPAPPPTLTPAYPTAPPAPPPAAPANAILTDGSALAGEITAAVAAKFQRWQPTYTVEIGMAGTSAGFSRLCASAVDLAHTARPIDAREAEACAQNGVKWLEVVIGYDVLAVVASPGDVFLSCLTLDELRAVWGEGGTANWSAVRSGFPDLPITLISAELDPAQARFFADAVGGALRADILPGGDDPALLVAHTPGAVGYLDYGRFPVKGDPLRELTYLGIDAGAGCASPAPGMVWRGLYGTLARPMYLYVNRSSLQRLAVSLFAGYYFSADGQALIAKAGFMPASPDRYEAALAVMGGD